MTLFLLYHKRKIDDVFYDTKIIGIYSSYEKVIDVIRDYSLLLGFSDYKNDFYIKTFDIIRKRKLKNKKNIIYLLIGVKNIDIDEIIISYNIYFSKVFARFVWLIKKIKKDKIINKFYIDKYLIDHNYWQEGFVTI